MLGGKLSYNPSKGRRGKGVSRRPNEKEDRLANASEQCEPKKEKKSVCSSIHPRRERHRGGKRCGEELF